MSQSTSAHAQNTFQSYDSEQERYQAGEHLQYKSAKNTNGAHFIQPLQRADSFGTPPSLHEPKSNISTETSFNFDHPTPADSTNDGSFHTPEIDELLWGEYYNAQGELYTLNDLDETRGMNHSGQYHPPRSTGLVSHKNSLPSPQSTNFSTPDASGHSKMPSQSSTLFTSPMVSPSHLKRPIDMDVNMSESRQSYNYLETPVAGSSPHITSPVIQISSVTRGDSPARSDSDARRISKKRSASNLSQGEYFPRVENQAQSSMLMPPSQEDDQDPDWDEQTEVRSGFAPVQRDDREHPSFNDLQEQEEQDKSVSEVRHWLETTSLDAFVDRNVRGQVRPAQRPDRLRSRSTGARPHPGQRPILKPNPTPGPGLVIEEDSEYYYSSDDEESNLSINPEIHNTDSGPQPLRKDSEVAPDEIAPLSSDFFRARPWQDPLPARPPNDNVAYQPESSQAAIYKYNLKAKEFDALSRSATWGTQQTRRRLSDGDMSSLMGDNKTRHLSLTKSKIRDRGNSFLQKARSKAVELKRSNSRTKPGVTAHETEKVSSPEPIDERSSTESQTLPFSSSFSKPKSPSIAAALRGTTGPLTAVGAGTTGLAIDTDHQPEGFLKRTIRRVRSKSDVSKSPKHSGGFIAKIAQEGGMPIPALTSPKDEEPVLPSQSLTPTPAIQDSLHSPIRMALSPRPANIIPNFSGFKLQVLELNPNLPPFLVARIAHDQERRYKRLVMNKAEHLKASTSGNCRSDVFCISVGGEAEILPPRPNARDTSNNSSHFRIAPGADSDNEDAAFDGIVTPAAFPDGIPLPPTKKLPAKFECPLCFQVKTFNKPSDWTKHVHEDVQPFTCTFPGCSEPKPFKRKADWVRHENERHRHLEWWRCNLSECTHVCYRKDNFVQHLVREHKRKEPKTKGRSNPGSKNKAKSTIYTPEELEFWNLVDKCRHEGAHDARQEPCKFCNNVCTSWKRLSVHVGKHMEQIAMPVLGLVEKRIVTEDTVISPVEPLQNTAVPFYGFDHVVGLDNVVSPFSAPTTYHSSSAEQSPHPALGTLNRTHILGSNYNTTSVPPRAVGPTPFSYGVTSGGTDFSAYPDPSTAQYAAYDDGYTIYQQNGHMPAAQSYPATTTTMAPDAYKMQSTYNTQVDYYSSPEQHYVAHHANGAMPHNSPLTQMQGHLHTPVTTQGMPGHDYGYPQQQAWHQ